MATAVTAQEATAPTKTDVTPPDKSAAASGTGGGLSGLLGKALSDAMDPKFAWGYFTLPGITRDRYYCLLNAKTGEKQPAAVLGRPLRYTNGEAGFQVVAIQLLVSCEANERSGRVTMTPEGENYFLASKVNSAKPSISILDTRLANLLSNNPSTSNDKPQWPRIAISELRVPTYQVRENIPAVGFTLRDCVYFNATVWTNETASEQLENVSVCGADMARLRIKGYDNRGAVMAWQSSAVSGETTGQTRTSGPLPPAYGLGKSDFLKLWLDHGYGLLFLGHILHSVGYDPNFDERRIWLIKSPQ